VSMETIDRAHYELRFQSLSDTGRALAFPCDAVGRVDMDALGSLALNDYLYARTVVGREFLRPCVRMCLDDQGQGVRTSRLIAPAAAPSILHRSERPPPT